MRHTTLIIALLTLAAGAIAADTSSPEKFLATRGNNLPSLPAGWIATKPVQLAISFNLNSPPNSAAANAFLKKLNDTLTTLPPKKDMKIYRQLAPNKFQYTFAMTFKTWDDFMIHEGGEAFLAFYRDHWKANVTEAEERIFVLDDESAR